MLRRNASDSPRAHSSTLRALGLIAGYMICFWFVRLVFLTIVAFTFTRSADTSESMLQKIGDIVRANQVLTYGFSAILFTVLLQILQPLTRTQFKQVFNLDEFQNF